MDDPLKRPRIEIRGLVAVNPDADGRPRRLLVLGLCDSDSDDISVTLPHYDAHSPVRLVDPERSFCYGICPKFAADLFVEPQGQMRAFVWLAEFEVGSYPSLSLIRLGAQAPPLKVHASYLHRPVAENGAIDAGFDFLKAEPGFEVGVLMVHGIGAHRTTDTLRQWSTELQRWVSLFFDATMIPIARRLDLGRLHHWETTMRVRKSLDMDHVKRSRLATRFVRAAESLSDTLDSNKALLESAERMLRELDTHDHTVEEIAGRDAVIRCNAQSIGATAFAGDAAFTAASLLDPGRCPSEPANAELQLDALAPDGYLQRSRWLLTEAHWAETFRPPDFTEFCRWAIRAGPVAFIHYFGIRVRRSRKPWFASGHYLFPLAVAIALMQCLMFMLLVIAAIPVPWLRMQVAKLERTLTGVIGDSYVFVVDDLQRRAILERVRHDLRWLLARSRRVVVVAHSQGAAIVHRALEGMSEGVSLKLDSIVTLGAGLKVLGSLAEHLNNPIAIRAGWAAMLGAVVMMAGVVVFAIHGPYVAIPALLAGLVALGYGGVKAAKLLGGEPLFPPNVGLAGEWLDYYAAHDPVSWGPIANVGMPSYRSYRVRNRDSIVSDHNTYWENADEFVGPLARHLAKAAGFAPVASLLPDDPQVIALASAARVSRVRILSGTRWVVLACSVALVLAHRSELLDVLRSASGWLIDRATIGAGSVAMPTATSVVGALSPLLPLVVYLAVLLPLWRSWGNRELLAVLRREPEPASTGWLALYSSLLSATIVLTLAIVIGLDTVPACIGWVTMSAGAAAIVRKAHRAKLVAPSAL